MVSKLRVGPHNREPHVWNRQLLMMKRLQHLFPCLQEIDFDQVSPNSYVPLMAHCTSDGALHVAKYPYLYQQWPSPVFLLWLRS